MQPPSPPPPPFPPNLTVAPPPSSSSSDSSRWAYNTKTRIHGGVGACAACKHQRRRCPPDCVLLPFFPGDNRQQFDRANQLFGVHNIVKILKKVSPELREDAAKAIIFESNARAAYPVDGCLHFLRELQRRIKIALAELEAVRRCIEIARSNINDRRN